jgi:hypothetical protein
MVMQIVIVFKVAICRICSHGSLKCIKKSGMQTPDQVQLECLSCISWLPALVYKAVKFIVGNGIKHSMFHCNRVEQIADMFIDVFKVNFHHRNIYTFFLERRHSHKQQYTRHQQREDGYSNNHRDNKVADVRPPSIGLRIIFQ